MNPSGGTPPALARAFGETDGGGAPGRGAPLERAEVGTWAGERHSSWTSSWIADRTVDSTIDRAERFGA